MSGMWMYACIHVWHIHVYMHTCLAYTDMYACIHYTCIYVWLVYICRHICLAYHRSTYRRTCLAYHIYRHACLACACTAVMQCLKWKARGGWARVPTLKWRDEARRRGKTCLTFLNCKPLYKPQLGLVVMSIGCKPCSK